MNDEMIEKMARAMEPDWFGNNASVLGNYPGQAEANRERARLKARAALSAIHGKHVMLPREPTKAIQDALIDAVRDGIAINDDTHRTARHAYRAMIQAGEIK